MENKQLLIIAMSPVGEGLSGGDRIFIELARNAARMGIATKLITWLDGVRMTKRNNLVAGENLIFQGLSIGFFSQASFFLCYIARIIRSTIWSITVSILQKKDKKTVIYSASDFLMDSIPGIILKLRFPWIVWAATFYLAAPNPFTGYKELGTWRMPTVRGILYWVSQQPIYWIIKRFGDFVFVTSLPDVSRFPKQAKQKKVIVIQGGVDLRKIAQARKSIKTTEKIYDAVFQGRFHPQKGVIELLDIWSLVVEKRSEAKLVMIGDGPLMTEVKKKIHDLDLENNVVLAGYVMDGKEKYTYFAQSRIVVHPAIYDSGGMAAAEAMGWELPAVSFDLEALKTYYPQGMIKVPLNDIEQFASTILALLENIKLYVKTQKEATDLIRNHWDWEKRAKKALHTLYA